MIIIPGFPSDVPSFQDRKEDSDGRFKIPPGNDRGDLLLELVGPAETGEYDCGWASCPLPFAHLLFSCNFTFTFVKKNRTRSSHEP